MPRIAPLFLALAFLALANAGSVEIKVPCHLPPPPHRGTLLFPLKTTKRVSHFTSTQLNTAQPSAAAIEDAWQSLVSPLKTADSCGAECNGDSLAHAILHVHTLHGGRVPAAFHYVE